MAKTPADRPLAKGELRNEDTKQELMRESPTARKLDKHPTGTSAGALGGMAAGAAAGALAGPVGAIAGAALGGMAGAVAGAELAEAVDPVAEDAYWRDNFANRDYVPADASYDNYGPAYAYGVNAFSEHRRRAWDDSFETDLRSGWHAQRGNSLLEWEHARPAVRDSWDRLNARTGHVPALDIDRS